MRTQNIHDLTGRRFGRLTVISLAGLKRVRWHCLCECGTTKEILADSLVGGRSESCGCLRRQQAVSRSTKHGMTDSREHRAWIDMKARCSPYWKESQYYFKRGIEVCPQWLDNFDAFYAHLGPCPDGLTLDRIDNDRGYEPGNVRWASPTTQTRNRRITRRLTFNGETKPLAEWAQTTGIDIDAIAYRLSCGWDLNRIMSHYRESAP